MEHTGHESKMAAQMKQAGSGGRDKTGRMEQSVEAAQPPKLVVKKPKVKVRAKKKLLQVSSASGKSDPSGVPPFGKNHFGINFAFTSYL